ncbi:MAG: DUF4352 domain-containing protein [Eubacteriales bacterium]|nr:DUF4352 domain-containing protein [Eubacteriales bacterium]
MKRKVLMITLLSIILLSACGRRRLPKLPKYQKAETASSITATTEEIGSVGDKAVLYNWEITVTQVNIVDSISDNQFFFAKPDDGNQFLQITISAKNLGKKMDTFLPTIGMGDDIRCKVVYQDEYEFTASRLITVSTDIHDRSINPLSETEGIIAFEIPDSVATATAPLILEFKSGSDQLKFKLR